MREFRFRLHIEGFIFLLFALLMVSCVKNNETADLPIDKVKLLDTLEIYDPRDGSTAIRNEGFFNDSPKVLVTIDATCLTCAEDFITWNKIMKRSKINEDSYRYYVQVHDTTSLFQLMRRWRFFHPVALDFRNEFGRLNAIPGDKVKSTLVVDEKLQIVHRGNPIYDKASDEYFKRNILKEEESVSQR